jgi:hypothetical protein
MSDDMPLSNWLLLTVYPLVFTVLFILVVTKVSPWMVRWMDRHRWSDWLMPRFENTPPRPGTAQRLDDLERRVARIEAHIAAPPPEGTHGR